MKAIVQLQLLAVALLLTLPSGAMALGIEVAVGGWSQNPSGYIAYEAASVGDHLDLKGDTGYSSRIRPMGRVKLDMPLVIPNIYLQATPMEFSGSGSKAVAFKFGNQTFSADTDFTSRLQLDQYDVAMYYGIPLLGLASLGTVNIDLGLNLRLVKLQTEVYQATTGFQDSRSTTLPVPMLYAGVQVSPGDRFSLELEGRGVAFSGNRYLDLLARLKAKLYGPVYAAAGWRYQEIKIDARGIEGSLKIAGPFLETGFAF